MNQNSEDGYGQTYENEELQKEKDPSDPFGIVYIIFFLQVLIFFIFYRV